MTVFLLAAAACLLVVLALFARPFVWAPAGAAPAPSKRPLAVVALVLPLVAAGLYFLLGNPQALAIDGQTEAQAQRDVDRMVDSLARKLETDPGNLKGWAMLARSYKVMGRSADAERAFDKAGAFIDGDAQLLADYADIAATNAGGSFEGKPRALVLKALKADPGNVMALWLLGSADMAARDFPAAIATWNRLLTLLPPGSDDARLILGSLEEARALSGRAAPMAALAKATGASIEGVVEVADALRAKVGANDTLMVIARVPGSRMPVAVVRVKSPAATVPFRLDDSVAMTREAPLSSAGEVEVEARISVGGQAMPASGDLISSVRKVKVGATGVALRVDTVRP